MPNTFTLRGSTGSETPINIHVVHTQGDNISLDESHSKFDSRLRCFHSIKFRMEGEKQTRRGECLGTDPEDFWHHLLMSPKRKECVWVFGYSLPDHLTRLGFWRLLDDGVFTLDPKFCKDKEGNATTKVSWTGKMVLEDRPFFVVCRAGDVTYKFVDVCNYWPSGLSVLAADAGIPLCESASPWSDDEDWQAVNANRIEIVSNAVVTLINQWRKEHSGTFQYTAALMAMSDWKKRCDIRTPDGKRVDVIFKPDHKSHELERDAYFGGRTQCYYVGEYTGTVYHVDCNSLFPFVMREYCYPRRFSDYSESETPARLAATRNTFGMVARVKINSDKYDFPVRIDGLQYHCRGNFWASLAGPELLRAVDAGVIEAVELVQYYSMAPIFRSWVDYWYERKIAAERSNPPKLGEREFAKMMLNSLYGKFAQRSKHWRDIAGVIPPIKWGGWPEYDYSTKSFSKWRAVGGNAQKLVDGKEPRHSFPLISAYVSSYAREYMRRVIGMAGYENVLYSATDSLILTSEGYDRLFACDMIHPWRLGAFKEKGKYSNAKIIGPNHYWLDDKLTCSGLIGASYSQGGDGTDAEIVESVGSIIQREMPETVRISRVKVPSTTPDYRGKILANGRWEPYRVSELTLSTGLRAEFVSRRAYSLGMVAGRIPLICDV